MQWTVVIPARALPTAKSRLAEATPDPQTHAQLAAALRSDTIAAALACRSVAHVLLVVDKAFDVADGVEVLVQTSAGLNPAVAEGAVLAVERWPELGIAALLGDLPCVTPDELDAALRAAAGVPRGFVPDASGSGTTLLTARPDMPLQPRFGPDSAARHALLATELPGGPGLRRDVDTLDDLRSALELGVGPATLAASSSVVHLSGR